MRRHPPGCGRTRINFLPTTPLSTNEGRRSRRIVKNLVINPRSQGVTAKWGTPARTIAKSMAPMHPTHSECPSLQAMAPPYAHCGVPHYPRRPRTVPAAWSRIRGWFHAPLVLMIAKMPRTVGAVDVVCVGCIAGTTRRLQRQALGGGGSPRTMSSLSTPEVILVRRDRRGAAAAHPHQRERRVAHQAGAGR